MTHQLIDMERRLIESERLNQSALPAQTNVQSEGSDTSSPTSRSPKEMKEKISQLQRTNAELKHQVTTQKTEITKMKEIVKREVGEQATDLLSTLHSQTSDSEGWRGRSQTISLLKSKLKEAQRRLNNAASVPSELSATGKYSLRNNGTTIAPSDSASRAADGAGYVGTVVDFDERHRSTISEVSSARRAKNAQISDMNKQLEAIISEKTSKLSAANARITVLETDAVAFRAQLARVIEKTENDDKLLSAYKAELEGKRALLKEATATARGGFSATITQMTDTTVEQSVDHSEQIARLEKEVESLRATLTAKNVPTDEYSQLLKRQVEEYRLKYEHVENILNKERAAAKSSVADNNTSTEKIPQEALLQLSLLKSEVTSLKDRISLMKGNHEAEIFTVNRVSSEKLSAIEEENKDLKVQYQKMKVALAEALTASDPDEENANSHSRTPPFTPTPPQQDGPVPDSD
eukprot:TRINITY_DN11721_c0_g1_i1.p1 TRINITY_DN11721_c0_g1~~TRINITY_DN11721_c0_g1_i1.p1  ORF type:complete len:541 (+),score=120.74 TRINITY_DN11721_c0_g1_i1:231-1625(+)